MTTERHLWNTGDSTNAVLCSASDRDLYLDAIGVGARVRRHATDVTVTSDTLTVDLVRYNDPHTGTPRWAVHHDDPAATILWDYAVETSAIARFDDHVARLRADDIEFVDDTDDTETQELAATVADVLELLASTAERPVLSIDNYSEPPTLSVQCEALVSEHAKVLTQEALLDFLGVDQGHDPTDEDREYIRDELLPGMQTDIARLLNEYFSY